MKMTIFSLFVAIGTVFATESYSQVAKVSIVSDRISTGKVIDKIEEQTDYLFVYNVNEVDLDRSVSLKAENTPVAEVLNKIFKGTGIYYIMEGKNIMLMNRTDDTENSKQSDNQVKGIVKDENGEPIIGANVTVKGQSIGTITDIDGLFAINASADAVLQISFIGYVTREVKVGNKRNLDITLIEDTQTLEEVVVVGYGTQKKANLTGAVATVSQETLKDRPVANVGHALQGVIPNLNVTVASGQPGASASYNIRGTTSPNGGDPLVLVDGVETNLDRINSNDIESITVLKDAASAAVYGARAAFGVILITTKNGEKNSKAQVSYSGHYSFSAPTVSTEYETRGYYSAKIADTFLLSTNGVPYTSYTDEEYQMLWERRNDKTESIDRPWVQIVERNGEKQWLYLANFDWYNYLYDDSRPTWDHNINIKGGTKDFSYMISGRYYTQDGMDNVNGDNFSSYNFRAKLRAEITPWLTVGSNTKYFSSTYKYYGRESESANYSNSRLHALASIVPVNPDGTAVYYNTMTNSSSHALMNGWSAMMAKGKTGGHNRTQEFSTTFDVELKLHKTFNVKADFTYTSGYLRNDWRAVNVEYSKYPGEILTATTGTTFKDQYKEKVYDQKYYVTNVYATYNNMFAKYHHVTVMGGFNYEAKYYKNLTAANTDLLSEDLSDFNLAVGTDNFTMGGGQNEYAIMGLFYRAAYDYKGKYLAEVNGRYDGSSRFPRGNRFGFFPSFSGAYRISEEAFFEPLRNVIDNLKLRVSYGSLGNQQIGYYDFVQEINTNGSMNYSLDDSTLANHATVSDPVSSNQTWEKVISKNLGFDLNMLRNRLSVTAEFYIRDTQGILGTGKSLPSIYGATEPQVNSNDLRTKGFEITVGWNDSFRLAGKPFLYGVTASISKYSAKYTKCDNPSGLISDPYVGKDFGEIWGYRIDGLFENDEVAAEYASQIDLTTVLKGAYAATGSYGKGVRGGDPRYLDLNGDKVVNAGKGTLEDHGDRIIIGNTIPRFSYGVNLNASWCGFDVQAFFQGIGRKDWNPGSENNLFWGPYSRPYATFMPKDFMSDVWTEENPDGYFPRIRAYAALQAKQGTVYYASDRYLQNIAYCRLKNLTVGYTIPKSVITKLHISDCRVYASAENLFTWTPFRSKYIDPEQAAADTNAQTYPWCKTYSLGVNITF